MNVYIRLEVRARELEGRLLLALAAAERGHEVLLGELRPLLAHRTWLPPGVYHEKSLTPAPRKLALHARLADAGFVITSQDEEHGLLQPEYGSFAAQRYSDEALGRAAAVMAWGPRDAVHLAEAYPDRADRIRATGSPRVDLWRPELAAFHRVGPPDGPDPATPYVLYASNVMVTNRNPFWVNLREQREAYFRGPDDPTEFDQYRASRDEFALLEQAVRTVRRIATSGLGLHVVVRPHPTEADGAWEDLLGPVPNVTVTRSGALGPWIRGARCVLHNGSTSGLEAAVVGTPIVPLVPDGWRAELLTNRLGPAVAEPEEALARVRALHLDPEARDGAVRAARAGLAGLLEAVDGPLAADRIVAVWDGLADRTPAARAATARDLLLGRAHHRAGRLRTTVRGARGDRRSGDGASGAPGPARFETAHKFPPLTARAVDGIVERFRRSLDRFHDVDVSVVGPRLVRVRKARRRGRGRPQGRTGG